MDFEQWWEIKHEEIDDSDNGWFVHEIAEAAWDASRDNQQEYQKYEFCRDMECDNLYNQASCVVDDPYGCVFTAREFHHWLKENGYRIVKDR
jgi:UDP-N-acetyl-D-mannosaminuronic acid transferase (WecB/TagA/CpsF family)